MQNICEYWFSATCTQNKIQDTVKPALKGIYTVYKGPVSFSPLMNTAYIINLYVKDNC